MVKFYQMTLDKYNRIKNHWPELLVCATCNKPIEVDDFVARTKTRGYRVSRTKLRHKKCYLDLFIEIE